jgi:hypothetical protein
MNFKQVGVKNVKKALIVCILMKKEVVRRQQIFWGGFFNPKLPRIVFQFLNL